MSDCTPKCKISQKTDKDIYINFYSNAKLADVKLYVFENMFLRNSYVGK